MLGPVIDNMATLAEGPKIPAVIMSGIVIQMRGSQINARGWRMISKWGRGVVPQYSAAIVAPTAGIFVPPTAIAKMTDDLAMGPFTVLAPTLSPLKPHHIRQLLPIDGIKPTVLRADRHQLASRSLACRRACGK